MGRYLEIGLWEVTRFRWSQEMRALRMELAPLEDETPKSLQIVYLEKFRSWSNRQAAGDGRSCAPHAKCLVLKAEVWVPLHPKPPPPAKLSEGFWRVHWSARATTTECHWLGVLNHSHLFLMVLEAKSPRCRCQQGWFLVKASSPSL